MPSFHNGAVEIAYLDEGEGDPILLVHGFASSKNVNWVYPTWVSELKKNGRRVIALDNRGHGDSSQALRFRAISYRHHGRRRHRADGSSRASSAPTSWAIRWAARMTAWLAQSAAAAAALGDLRRHRHGPDRGRRSRRERGAGAGGAVARGRHRSGRDGRFAPSPTRPAPIAGRWRPACAARGA